MFRKEFMATLQPTITDQRVSTSFEQYCNGVGFSPLFLTGDALTLLGQLPDATVDCIMTSPPYWGQRDYGSGGIGLEQTWQEYVSNLVEICGQLKRILKPTGSFWLNIGDAYQDKNLLGLPWRVCFSLTDQQGGLTHKWWAP